MRTGFLIFALSLLLSYSALAAPLEINTHTAAVPEQSYQIAKTWFLPDWQAGVSGRTETAPSGSGDRHDLACSTYGGCAGVPAHMSCKNSYTVDGTTCYKTCSCLSGYVRANSSNVCQGCVNPCNSVTAVATPYGCQTPWPVCPSKCQVAYPDNCRNRTAVSTPYGCKTYFSDCSTKCQVAYPDNCHNRTAVPTPYGCQTHFSDCSSKCEVAYPDNCHNRTSYKLVSSCVNGCAKGEKVSDCDSRCATGCKAKCDAGYHLSSDEMSCGENGCAEGYEPGKTCGAGYTLDKSGQSGTQYCGKCVEKECAAGTTTCATGQISEENGYYSGDKPCLTCKPGCTYNNTDETCQKMIDTGGYGNGKSCVRDGVTYYESCNCRYATIPLGWIGGAQSCAYGIATDSSGKQITMSDGCRGLYYKCKDKELTPLEQCKKSLEEENQTSAIGWSIAETAADIQKLAAQNGGVRVMVLNNISVTTPTSFTAPDKTMPISFYSPDTSSLKGCSSLAKTSLSFTVVNSNHAMIFTLPVSVGEFTATNSMKLELSPNTNTASFGDVYFNNGGAFWSVADVNIDRLIVGGNFVLTMGPNGNNLSVNTINQIRVNSGGAATFNLTYTQFTLNQPIYATTPKQVMINGKNIIFRPVSNSLGAFRIGQFSSTESNLWRIFMDHSCFSGIKSGASYYCLESSMITFNSKRPSNQGCFSNDYMILGTGGASECINGFYGIYQTYSSFPYL